MKPIKVGLLGIGTVGAGTFNVLRRNQEEIRRRAGRGIESRWSPRATSNAPAPSAAPCEIVATPFLVVNNPDIDIVVELIGGYEPRANWCLQAIANGKHVVTANKALLALHGNEIFQAAQDKGVMVAFEAAVAGGIPDHQGAARRPVGQPHRIGGRHHQRHHQLHPVRDARQGPGLRTVLKQAQELGYAEADPTFDIEGVDAAHKLTIMSAIAFGIPMQFGSAHVEGISKLQAVDIRYAEELGYRIKLLGITRRTASTARKASSCACTRR
jgi:homoserine dehydrogenase